MYSLLSVITRRIKLNVSTRVNIMRNLCTLVTCLILYEQFSTLYKVVVMENVKGEHINSFIQQNSGSKDALLKQCKDALHS